MKNYIVMLSMALFSASVAHAITEGVLVRVSNVSEKISSISVYPSGKLEIAPRANRMLYLRELSDTARHLVLRKVYALKGEKIVTETRTRVCTMMQPRWTPVLSVAPMRGDGRVTTGKPRVVLTPTECWAEVVTRPESKVGLERAEDLQDILIALAAELIE